ncbi:MAG TPA: TonB-dependent receptor [Sphingomicrobium sp.]|nr:TonB-dependent receptor [Sphingomicrobium sp.]
MRVNLVRAALLGTAAAAALYAMPASAQEDADTSPQVPANAETRDVAAEASDQEIVVTARRRNELLLDVPVAVTAYSGEQLDRQGALDLTDIGDTTPNVTFETSRGTNTTLSAFIRGVGQQDPVAGFEQGVGLYLDDVYLNRPQAAVLDIYDVERIEVLRGPQGTLYGRNTIGGAIKYVTRRLQSDGPHFNLRANIGTYNQIDVVGSVSVPLAPVLRAGVTVARLSRGGFGKNLTTGADNYNKDINAARATIELEPSDRVFFRVSGDYVSDNSNPRGGHRLIPNQCTIAACNVAFPVLDDEFDSRGALNDPTQKVRSGGLALHGDVGINEWLKFRTITAYRSDRSKTPIDFDALPYADVDVPAIYRNRQFSQEFQVVADKGPLQGVAGIYYLNAHAFNVFDVRLYTTCPVVPLPGCVIALPGLSATTRGNVDTKTWAVFGDFTYDFSQQLSVSLGGRFTNDKRRARVFRANLLFGGAPELGGSDGFGVGTQFGAPTSSFDGRRKDTAFTPRASISFKPNRDHNLYVSYSRGFKGGGFDPRGLTTSTPRTDPAVPPTPQQIYDFMAFDPETVDSYEAGWKAALFDRRLQLALAVFQADYKDVQIPGSAGGVTSTGVPTFIGITTNAGKARFRGVELETNLRAGRDLMAAGDRLNFAGTLGYLDAKYLRFLTVVSYSPVTGLPLATPIEFDVAPFRKVQNTPKWTLSGSVDYDVPVAGGRLNLNSTLSYRSASQQFELRIPGLDQKGFALWDANLVWRSAGNRYQFGLHGKNLTDKRYITSGYNFLRQNPFTGEFILANGQPGINPTLGRTGILTAFYGNPRQVFLSAAVNF